MKKTFDRALLSLFSLLPLFAFAPTSVRADGLIMKPDPNSSRWDYSNETNQQAYINYDNGKQKMILSVGVDAQNINNVLWLFPVPADPNKVSLDVVTSLPQMSGGEISQEAASTLVNTRDILQMTQIYTIPYVMESKFTRNSYTLSGYGDTLSLGTTQSTAPIEHDVVVYDHLEKEGITSEIITAKTTSGLYDYLKTKNLEVDHQTISVLDAYIGKDYSFVASWITTTNTMYGTSNYHYNPDNPTNQKGVFVTFPTNDLYFPLIPTSAYGSRIVPATIRIIGNVSPKIFLEIKDSTKTNYYIDNYPNYTNELSGFYGIQNASLNYTKITINSPSNNFTNDLWISRQAPIKTYFSSYFAQYPEFNTIMLLFLSSILSGILAGLLVFKELRRNILKLGLIGCSNCFSILGLLLTIMWVGTKKKDENIELLLVEIRRKGYVWKRRLALILCVVAIPFLIYGICALPSLIEQLGHLDTDPLMDGFGIVVMIVYVFPALALAASHLITRVKPENEQLFSQLKLANYSSWTFRPIDKMKFAYVPVFSVTFLIVSWLLVEFAKILI